ncbi:hypothetical protein MTO96_007047 [Rhipicephalus appendiculatus]
MNMIAPFLVLCCVSVAVARLGPSLVARALGWSALFSLVTQFTAHGASFLLTFALQPGQQARALLLKLPVKPTTTEVVFDAVLVFLRYVRGSRGMLVTQEENASNYLGDVLVNQNKEAEDGHLEVNQNKEAEDGHLV